MGVYGIGGRRLGLPRVALAAPEVQLQADDQHGREQRPSSPTAIHNTTSAIRASPIRSFDRPELNAATETSGRLYR